MASILTALCALVLLSLSHAFENGDVRLVNGPSPNKGRIEVYYDGVWGTVCDDSWNTRDGDLVCKQLGFEGVEHVRYRAYYGEGTGPIWIDQIHCESHHQSIIDCRHNGWGLHDCRHREDAGLECKRKEVQKPDNLPLRLSCPEHSTCGSCKVCADKKFPDPTDCLPKATVEGIVEAFYNNEWRPVSNEGWDLSSAGVACGQLGYPLVFSIPTLEQLWCNWDATCTGSGIGSASGIEKECTDNEDFRKRLTKSWIKGLDCTGKESSLNDCFFESFGPSDSVSISNVATVKCGYNPHPECNTNKDAEVYRTRGSSVPWQGRVEARVKGEWGTVSDLLWGKEDASVVCRALGYGTAKTATYHGNFGRGVGIIHYSNLKCTGSERLLSQCTHVTGPTAQIYGHARDAGVICNVPNRQHCDTPSSRIVKQPQTNGYMSDFVEIHDAQNGWGFLCFESVDLNIANVICRETSQSFAFRVARGDHPDFTRTRYSMSLNCTGTESSLRDCKRNLKVVKQCTNKETIIQCQTDLPDLVPDLNAFQSSLRYYPYVENLPLYYLRCAHEENCLSSSADGQSFDNNRVLLRFSSQTMNFGTADFIPVLDQSEWIWHSCHNHYHSFEAFIHYDLIDPDTGDKVAEGHKASFCLEDSYCATGGTPRYRCSSGVQGISVNCGDLYNRHLDCQWIDITDLAPGTYILRQTVNPDNLALESDYANNVEECTITYYQGGYLYLVPDSCSLSDH